VGICIAGVGIIVSYARRGKVIFQRLEILATIIVIGCSLALLISRNWRQAVIALALLYVGVFWLVGLILPIGLAAIKLVVGWMAGAVLGASAQTYQPAWEEGGLRSVQYFRLAAGLVIILLIFSLTPALATLLIVDQVILWGAMGLIGLGLLQLGITTNTLKLFAGLLTALAGFEIIYATLESSVLVAGLLAIVNIGLALSGSYLLSVVTMEETP
jgi:hypothetical protein